MCPSSIMFDRRTRKDRRCQAHPLAGELARAIDDDAIEVLFQPQYSAGSGEVVGAEALARWTHPKAGELAGDALFGIAADSGMERLLSRHMHRKAIRAAADWSTGICLSVNVTAVDLEAPDFSSCIIETLEDAGFPPERLTLEITEQALVDEIEQSAARLQELADRGIAIALDDFGAGFCNFRYLKALPLHCIKLDRSMVEGVAHDARDLAVLRGIVAMAHALGLKVIAEGVETDAQRDAVAREGCETWQGFLGAKPMTQADFWEFCAQLRLA